MCSKKKSVQKKKKTVFFLLLLLLSQKKDELLLESVNFRFSTKCAYEKKKKLKETPQLRLRKEYGLTSAPKTDTSGDTQLKEKRFADDACKVAKRSSGGCKTSRFSKESCLHETTRNTPPLHLLCSLNRLSMHGAFMESVKKKKNVTERASREERLAISLSLVRTVDFLRNPFIISSSLAYVFPSSVKITRGFLYSTLRRCEFKQ